MRYETSRMISIPSMLVTSILSLAIVVSASCGSHSSSGIAAANYLATYDVVQDTLTVSVIEQGQLAAVRSVPISSQVRGTITYIVEEGTRVQAGDDLIRLDEEEQLRKREELLQTLDNNKRQLSEAESDKALYELESKGNIDDAERAIRFAKLSLKQYEEGTSPLREREIELAVERAEINRKKAVEQLERMPDMLAADFVTAAEVREAELTAKETAQAVATQQANLKVFRTLDRPKELERLRADITAAEVRLSSLQQQRATQLARRDAAIASAQFTLRKSEQQLSDLDEEIKQLVIIAPEAGVVVYGDGNSSRWSRQSTPEVGNDIGRNKVIMRLPDLTQMRAEVGVDESYISLIEVGQQVRVTVDGLGDLALQGTVQKIANTASENWRRDVKEYRTEITLDDVPADVSFRPGMTIAAEIMVGSYPNSLLVPIAAIQHDDEGSFVFRKTGSSGNNELDRVMVEVEHHNDQWAAVAGDIQVGNQVVVIAEVPQSSQSAGL